MENKNRQPTLKISALRFNPQEPEACRACKRTNRRSEGMTLFIALMGSRETGSVAGVRLRLRAGSAAAAA